MFHTIGVPPSVGRMLLATIGSSTKQERTEKQGAGKEAVTMLAFGRDVVAVDAAMVV